MSQKSLVRSSPEGEWVVESTSIPVPAPGQVLVKVRAIALNPVDWKIHVYNFYPEAYPITNGFDGAGVVEDFGSGVAGLRKGDRVIFQGWYDENAKKWHGTFQEYLVVPDWVVAKIPGNINYKQAATVFGALSTVAGSLYSQKPGTASLKLPPPWKDGHGKFSGKSIFIPGGSGQVGLFALQFAKLSGFKNIIATASLRNADLLKSYGATHFIDRSLPPHHIVEEVLTIAGGPVDLVYNAVGTPDTLSLSVAVLPPGGKLVVVIAPSDELAAKFAAKSLQYVYPNGAQGTEENRGALVDLYAKLPEYLEKGVIRPAPYELLVGGLKAIPGGLERLQNDQVSGVKLVVVPHEDE